ncbi:MAG: ABC transporter transmembrane domain-containing protein [Desulfobacterales bacterium]
MITDKLLHRIKPRHRTILGMIFENRYRLLLAMVCMLVIAATTAGIAYMVKPVIDRIFIQKDMDMLKLLPFAVVLISLLKNLATYGQTYLMQYVGQQIIWDLRNRLYGHILDMPIAFFHREKTGTLMARVTSDVAIVKNMVSSSVTGALKDCFSIIGLTAVIFYQDWQMAVIALVVIPLIFMPVVKIGRRVRRVAMRRQESVGDLSAFLHETFAGNKIVKAFGMESYEKKRFLAKSGRLFKMELKQVRAKALSSPFIDFLGYIAIAVIIFYGGFKVIAGESTPGTFFSFIAAVGMLYEPIKKLSQVNNTVQEGLAAVDRIFDVMESRSEIREAENPIVLQTGPHRVSFKHVFFKYDSEYVLNDINLEVKPGEIVALAGMSGGGKTTLVNLIPRFYDVSEGSVEIDGIDVRNIGLASLRRQIAVVTQEPILFNDTVYNNIAYGNTAATREDVENAAKAAYAYDFIRGFPDGFDTVIGELGARLSGGEKQRMCVARALLKNAPILILDEATSSLDSESEALVQKALDNLMRGRTTFVIAHRLSTILNADNILMIVNGQVVEQGSHGDLLNLKQEYFKLYNMQYRHASKSV